MVVVPLVACALLLGVSLLVAADWYRPARRALAPLFLLACLSLMVSIGALVVMVVA